MDPARTQRKWPLIIGVVVALPVAMLVATLVFLGANAGSVVCFHNSRAEPLVLSVDGKQVGGIAPGQSLTYRTSPGSHRLVAHGKVVVVEQGEFDVPKQKDPLLGWTGVYVLGDQPRLALVERCYGACADRPLNVVAFNPPGKLFPMPAAVYASVPLDEPFAERDIVQGTNKIRTHLCGLSASGQPRCEVR